VSVFSAEPSILKTTFLTLPRSVRAATLQLDPLRFAETFVPVVGDCQRTAGAAALAEAAAGARTAAARTVAAAIE
jgi:hypothetical protein